MTEIREQEQIHKQKVLTIRVSRLTFFTLGAKICLWAFVLLLVLQMLHKQMLTEERSFLGYYCYPIESGGMEPTFGQNAWILFKKVKPARIQEDDILVYRLRDDPELIICGRVVEIYDDDMLHYITQQDSRDKPDNWRISQEDVVGVAVAWLDGWGPFMGFTVSDGGIVFITLAGFGLLVFPHIRRYLRKRKTAGRPEVFVEEDLLDESRI